jgi:hypothetical protein
VVFSHVISSIYKTMPHYFRMNLILGRETCLYFCKYLKIWLKFSYLYTGGGKLIPTHGSSIEPPSFTVKMLFKDDGIPGWDGRFSILIGIFPAWDISCTVNLQKKRVEFEICQTNNKMTVNS